MNVFAMIKEAIHRMIPYSDISSAAGIESPVSAEMQKALNDWRLMYQRNPPWKSKTVETMNLPSYICSEIARQILLEAEFTITDPAANPATTEESKEGKAERKKLLKKNVLKRYSNKDIPYVKNLRAEYLTEQFQKVMDAIRPKLEIALAAGGFVIKPYPKDGQLYFDFVPDWDIYPIAFDDAGNLHDVIFPDRFQRRKVTYTRLERHQMDGDKVIVTNRAFRSNNPNSLGTECNLSEVPQWADLEPSATVTGAGGSLFGWFKTANANTVDLACPMGAAVFDKAVELLEEADKKLYSGLLWEYRSGRRKVHVSPEALKFKKKTITGLNGPVYEYDPISALDTDLYIALDVQKESGADMYDVFSPPFREASYINGLNQLLIRIEDLCGLSRGTLSDANTEARTATELKIVKQRSYATIADNQKMLEKCLRDVIRVMSFYADQYKLAPAGEYDVSFDWDDSIITDREQQMSERLLMMNAGIMSKAEVRAWYTGESDEQAEKMIQAIQAEAVEAIALPNLESGGMV